MSRNLLDPNNLPEEGKLPSSARDLKGQRFNQFVVQYYAYSKNWTPYWVCLCDCGNYFISSRKDITRKDNRERKSCGCYSKKIASLTHRGNLVGKRFGKLLAIEDTGTSTPDGHALYKCQCDCGNITYVNSCNLQSKGTMSCGCLGRSSGEYQIKTILDQHHISYKQEFSFSDLCGDRYPLRFDFAIFNQDQLIGLIEYQGEQHKTNVFCKSEEDFERDLYRDQLKRDYCASHNIPLYEIWYYDDLQKALLSILEGVNLK